MAQKRDKISKLSDADEDYFRPLGLKARKIAIDGKPDFRDLEDLHDLFALYDRATGGKLRIFCNQLATERALNNRLRVESVDKAESFTFALPQDLQLFLEKYYPTLFTKQEHARWFIRHFPQFRK